MIWVQLLLYWIIIGVLIINSIIVQYSIGVAWYSGIVLIVIVITIGLVFVSVLEFNLLFR